MQNLIGFICLVGGVPAQSSLIDLEANLRHYGLPPVVGKQTINDESKQLLVAAAITKTVTKYLPSAEVEFDFRGSMPEVHVHPNLPVPSGNIEDDEFARNAFLKTELEYERALSKINFKEALGAIFRTATAVSPKAYSGLRTKSSAIVRFEIESLKMAILRWQADSTRGNFVPKSIILPPEKDLEQIAETIKSQEISVSGLSSRVQYLSSTVPKSEASFQFQKWMKEKEYDRLRDDLEAFMSMKWKQFRFKAEALPGRELCKLVGTGFTIVNDIQVASTYTAFVEEKGVKEKYFKVEAVADHRLDGNKFTLIDKRSALEAAIVSWIKQVKAS